MSCTGTDPSAVIDGGNTATQAIKGDGLTGVTVEWLTVQHIHNAAQIAAVANNSGSGWSIHDNTVINNTTEGIQVGAQSTVTRNHVAYNGQLGITGYKSDGAFVTNNEIDHNGAPAYVLSEGGGMKFYIGNGITVSGNNVHDNDGDGIWFDTDVVNSTITGNTLANNVDATNHAESIAVELACNDTVSGNTVTGTGYSGIWLSSSHDVKVTGNTVAGPTHTIRLWSDNTRTTQAVCGPPSVSNDTVSGNTETLASGTGHLTGMTVYKGLPPTGTAFSTNTYHAPDCGSAHWTWNVTGYTFPGWQVSGMDTAGSCGP